jgi:hypothetical protein
VLLTVNDPSLSKGEVVGTGVEAVEAEDAKVEGAKVNIELSSSVACELAEEDVIVAKDEVGNPVDEELTETEDVKDSLDNLSYEEVEETVETSVVEVSLEVEDVKAPISETSNEADDVGTSVNEESSETDGWTDSAFHVAALIDEVCDGNADEDVSDDMKLEMTERMEFGLDKLLGLKLVDEVELSIVDVDVDVDVADVDELELDVDVPVELEELDDA